MNIFGILTIIAFSFGLALTQTRKRNDKLKQSFRDISAKQTKVEQVAAAYLPRIANANDNKAEDLLIKSLTNKSAFSAAKIFESAFSHGKAVEDRQAVLEAIEISWSCLKYASDEIRADADVVRAAVKKSGFSLQFANDKFRNDKEFVLAAINSAPLSFKLASDTLRADADIAKIAISLQSSNLEHCAAPIRKQKNFVMIAIENEGMMAPPSLHYADKQLWSDPELLVATEKKEKQKAEMRESSGFNRAYG